MPETEVDTFAGIDVSARELSVALHRGKGEDKPAMAKFSNHPSGHKALIAHLLRSRGACWTTHCKHRSHTVDYSQSPEVFLLLSPWGSLYYDRTGRNQPRASLQDSRWQRFSALFLTAFFAGARMIASPL